MQCPFPCHAMLNAAVFSTLGTTEEELKAIPPSRRLAQMRLRSMEGSGMQPNGLLYGNLFMIFADLMQPSATAMILGAGIFAVRYHVVIRVYIGLNGSRICLRVSSLYRSCSNMDGLLCQVYRNLPSSRSLNC